MTVSETFCTVTYMTKNTYPEVTPEQASEVCARFHYAQSCAYMVYTDTHRGGRVYAGSDYIGKISFEGTIVVDPKVAAAEGLDAIHILPDGEVV